jgi:hypothetical protein
MTPTVMACSWSWQSCKRIELFYEEKKKNESLPPNNFNAI